MEHETGWTGSDTYGANMDVSADRQDDTYVVRVSTPIDLDAAAGRLDTYGFDGIDPVYTGETLDYLTATAPLATVMAESDEFVLNYDLSAVDELAEPLQERTLQDVELATAYLASGDEAYRLPGTDLNALFGEEPDPEDVFDAVLDVDGHENAGWGTVDDYNPF